MKRRLVSFMRLHRRSVALLGLLIFVFVWGGESSARAAGDSLCGPFDRPYQLAQVDTEAMARERGVVSTDAVDRVGMGQGPIVELESFSRGAGSPLTPKESEALLALPKNAAGALPTDFELGPGVRISQSFFSPVLCATLARVSGPAGATLDQLVTVVPEGSIVVPNDVYLSAAAEIHSIEGADRSANGDPSSTTRRRRTQLDPDPYVSLQYGLAISGVRAARDLSAGAGVKIALLDSAPDVDHRDLSETTIKPLDGSSAKSSPGVHGTLMAGVISAVEGNGFGIMGLAPEAELIAIPVCTPTGTAGGSCTIYDLLQGLDLAWNAEADLVNLSLSGPPNALLERGVARLESLGVVVVAAAGNEGTDQERYPAAYPSVIGVGAIDQKGQLFAKSNRGDWVEILAPGVEILSTVPGNAFAFGSGTSLAAAHVTGELAVLTAAIGNAKAARAELFREASSAATSSSAAVSGLRVLPPVCDVFTRLALNCEL